eukprot:15360579-Ditylum_brightwellii.AAC.1
MARKAPMVQEIFINFPQSTVPKVSGVPTYEMIHIINKIPKENAASIYNDLGGGGCGQLALVLEPGH